MKLINYLNVGTPIRTELDTIQEQITAKKKAHNDELRNFINDMLPELKHCEYKHSGDYTYIKWDKYADTTIYYNEKYRDGKFTYEPYFSMYSNSGASISDAYLEMVTQTQVITDTMGIAKEDYAIIKARHAEEIEELWNKKRELNKELGLLTTHAADVNGETIAKALEGGIEVTNFYVADRGYTGKITTIKKAPKSTLLRIQSKYLDMEKRVRNEDIYDHVYGEKVVNNKLHA